MIMDKFCCHTLLLFHLVLVIIAMVAPSPGVKDEPNLPGKFSQASVLPEVSGFFTTRTFFQNYVLRPTPLKMKKSATLSKAFTLWDDSYFLSMEKRDITEIRVERKIEKDKSIKASFVSFQDFLQDYNHTDMYMVAPLMTYLQKDVMVPGSLQCDEITKTGRLVQFLMLFSSGGTKGLVHVDAEDNILCLYRGMKEVLILNPDTLHENTDNLTDPKGVYQDYDLDYIGTYPEETEYYHFNLTAGDCIYIPLGWVHQVRSYNSNLAISVWWNGFQNHEIDLDSCPTNIDLDLTLDKVTLTNYEDFTFSIEYLREVYMGDSDHLNLTMDSYMKIQTVEYDLHLVKAADRKEPLELLQQIFKALDYNQDQVLTNAEVQAASHQTWVKVQDHVLHIMDIMNELNFEKSQQYERPDQKNEL